MGFLDIANKMLEARRLQAGVQRPAAPVNVVATRTDDRGRKFEETSSGPRDARVITSRPVVPTLPVVANNISPLTGLPVTETSTQLHKPGRPDITLIVAQPTSAGYLAKK